MRKEPQRRYSSVDQFSNDIARHLEGRPVIARNDTVWYRAAKFVRRNKAAVMAALLILAVLVGGIIATSIQRARAERLFNDVRALANSFMFEIHDAIENLPGSTPARELVVRRALEYLDSLAREAASDEQLQRELATAYQKVGDVQGNPLDANLGDTAGALASYQKALTIREELAKKHPASVEDRRNLAISYMRIGDIHWRTGDTKPALEAYQQGIRIGEALLGADQLDLPASRELWRGYRNLAYTQATAGDFAAGLEALRKGQALGERLLALFHDEERGGFFQTASDAEGLVLRPKELYDNAVPSGNSAAAGHLSLRTYVMGEAAWERAGVSAIRLVRDALGRAPTGFGHALCALDRYLGPSREVAILGPPGDPRTDALVDEVVATRFLPNVVLAVGAPGDAEAAGAVPLLRDRPQLEGAPTAYVCERFACLMPVTTPQELAGQLAGMAG